MYLYNCLLLACNVIYLLQLYRYTKLRMFALKLKKKLNETVTQLHNAEQDKAKLEKMLNETGSGDNRTVPVSVDQVDNKVAEDQDKVASLEMRIKDLTETVKASEKLSADLEKVKGARPFIYFSNCRGIRAIFMSVNLLCIKRLTDMKILRIQMNIK